jgi:hypothetical protein
VYGLLILDLVVAVLLKESYPIRWNKTQQAFLWG